MTNTTADTHPILAAAHVAADEIGGTFDAPLAEDAVQAAFAVLAECWADTIRTGYGNEGPSRVEVRQMILGDLRDTLDALERLLGVIERQGDK
jgi:hypothetical protein